MTRASFRFYARLNQFLTAERRGQDFSCACARDATVKHMIEAIGVPHTEIALVLVDGEPAALDQPIEDGVRIAVYPKFESLDVSTITRVPQPDPGMPSFTADAHLGALARLLRMAGFDTLYDNAIQDAAIAKQAHREGRVLLTRDRDLLKHRAVTYGCYLYSVKPQEQLRELFTRLDLHQYMQPFSRCLKCNAPLRQVPKAQVLERLLPRVRERHERFWLCGSCDQLYWEGTHWQSMRRMLEALARPGPEEEKESS